MPPEEVFSEQQVSDILRRAAELMEKSAGGYTPGITREELERIAKEVGVDPKFLELAICEQGQSTSKKGPLHLTEEFERVIEGELDPADYDILAEHIKPLGNAGQPAMAQIGRSLQASAWTGVSQAKVTVNSRNGRTRLTVKSTPLFAFLMGAYPAVMGSIISAASLSEAGYIGWGIAAAAAFVAVGATAFSFLLKHGHEKARDLTEKLRGRISEEMANRIESPASLPMNENLEERLEQKAGS
jgi:hypothetical protein